MKKTRIGIVSIITILTMLLSMTAFAAKTVNVLDGKISITDTTGNGSGDASKYTATAKGSIVSKKSNTITIANESGKDGVLEFNYSVASADAFTIAGASASTSGSYSNPITAGGSVALVITSKKGLSDLTVTLTLTNITFQEMSDSSDMVYEFDSSLGAVTAGGTAIASGDTVTVGSAGTQMVATPASGATFIGWVDADNNIVSTSATYTQQATGNKTITAIFSKGTPYFMVDKKYIYSDLNDAASAGSTVVLLCNGTLPAGNYTIPSGVTLLIPMDDENTLYTTEPTTDATDFKKPTAYRTLTLAKGANITVNGAISLGGKQSSKIRSHGSVIGKYGCISMKSGSSITVNNGANLYAWGYIIGSGTITAKSGSTVYENFQLRDFRGGDVTSQMIDNKQKVLPMSQYYVQNIEVPLTLEAGAVENGFMAVNISVVGTQKSTIPFIGPNGLFKVTSGTITKDYDENSDRLIIDIDGDLEMGSLSLSMNLGLLIGTKTINSQNYVLPINGGITLNVNEGSNVNVAQDMALLPGGEINIYKGAKCTFGNGANAYIYDSDEWAGYCGASNATFLAVNYAPGGKYTRTAADLKDALVYIEGEIDASEGFVYTTKSGANICGAEGGIAKLQLGTNETTYQVTQGGSDATEITGWPEIAVTTAVLKNADGTYTNPEDASGDSWEYEYRNGAWVIPGQVEDPCAGGHSYGEAVITTPATHLAEGVKTYTCTVCGNEKTEAIAKTADHEWDAGVVTKEPTHLAEGVKTYTCACGNEKTETIAKTADHKWDNGVVTTAPTHTKEGVKTYTCACGETKTETIAKTSEHTFTDWTKVDGINHTGVCECGEEVTAVHEFEGFACAICGCDKIVTTTLYTIENGEIKINTELIWDVPEGTQIIVALYNADGKLINATISEATELAELVFVAEGVAEIKVYAWSGTQFMTPVSIAEEIAIAN